MRKVENRLLGIPVYYDDRTLHLSCAKGAGPWKWIVVGPGFRALDAGEKHAVLLHEVGHCKLWHVEKRVLHALRVLFNGRKVRAFCQQQELEADRYVAALGHGQELATALSRVRQARGPFHPDVRERITALVNYGRA